jgi:hypothetical protein
MSDRYRRSQVPVNAQGGTITIRSYAWNFGCMAMEEPTSALWCMILTWRMRLTWTLTLTLRRNSRQLVNHGSVDWLTPKGQVSSFKTKLADVRVETRCNQLESSRMTELQD